MGKQSEGANSPLYKKRFSDDDIELALQVQDKYGVPASVTLGQYALESGYGKYTSGTNNYFNIKNKTGGYANYDSKKDAFMAYGQLLNADRYTSQTKDAKSVKEYVTGIKNGGYAEDKNYVNKVMRVISSNGLTDLDNGNYSGTIHGGSSGSFDSVSDKISLSGNITRVVLILLLIGGGVILLITALSSGNFSVVNKQKGGA